MGPALGDAVYRNHPPPQGPSLAPFIHPAKMLFFSALLRAGVAEVTERCFPRAQRRGLGWLCTAVCAEPFSSSGFLAVGGELRWTVGLVYFKWRTLANTRFFSSKVSQNGRLQVHPGAMEEEAVRCDALPSQGALLAVSPALCAPQGPPPHQAG